MPDPDLPQAESVATVAATKDVQQHGAPSAPTALPPGIPEHVGDRAVVVEEIEERDPHTGRMRTVRNPIIADRVLVRLQPGIQRPALERLAQRHGASIVRQLRVPGAVYELELARGGAAQVRAAVERFQADAATVASAQPDVVYTIVADPVIPDDEHFDTLWGLHNTGQSGGTADADIDAPEAWAQTTGSDSVLAAVIDTGIDYTHPDLKTNIWTNPGEIPNDGIDNDGNGYVDDVHGYDFFNDDGDPMDDHFHGTHCAGTIGAVGDNDTGVAGVAWDVQLVAIKGLSAEGSSTGSILAECLAYAHAIGVDITSNSWGGGFSQLVYDEIVDAGSHGIITVVAAGNANTDLNRHPTTYPACIELPHVVTVAATDRNDAIASFSNWGADYVDLGAPGVKIISTTPVEETEAMAEYDLLTEYAPLNGTSMATPHVAGACVLAKAADPGTTPEIMRLLLMHTADATDAMATATTSGGRLNVATLVARAASSYVIIADHVLDDDTAHGSNGNSDDMWEAGETVGLTLELQNLGGLDAPDVSVAASSADGVVTVQNPLLDLGEVDAHASTSTDEILLAIDAGATPQVVDIAISVTVDGVEHGTLTVPLRIVEATRLTGRVTDGATGDGLGGVRVRAYGDNQLHDTWTDLDGTYTLRVPAGTMPVLATRRGWSPASTTVSAPAAGIDFVLDEWEIRTMRLDEATHATYPYPMDMNTYGHVLADVFTGLPYPGELVYEGDTHRAVDCSLIIGYYPGALNDFGDVASRTYAGDRPALFDRHGLVTDFSEKVDHVTNVITGVNNAGQVACYHSGSGERRAWLIDPATGSATEIFPDTISTAEAIDDAGRVYGNAVQSDDDDSGYIYNPADGSVQWLHPPESEHLHLRGCSADGTRCTGVLIWDDGTVRGFVSDGTTITPLADPWNIAAEDSWDVVPQDVDADGRCVGRFYHSGYRSDTRVAMLHLGDIPIDLNEVAPEDCDIILQDAVAINEAGDICGIGVNQFGLSQPRNEITFVLSRVQRDDQPPVARIDTGDRARVGDDLALVGIANDENGDGELSAQWSQLSGPGSASFADATAWRTTVSFDAAGTYQLQMRVTDPADQVTDATCTVVVDDSANAAPSVTLADEVISDLNVHTSWSGAGVALTATPSDSDGSIVRVEFYDVSGEPALLGSSRYDPWLFVWQSADAGDYSLRAKAYDDQGAWAWSNTVTITVTRDTAPVITMVSPANGQVFGQFESVTARATCDHPADDLYRIYLYLDGSRYETWSSLSDWPGTYEYTFDDLEPGKHIIHFQVIDLYDANTSRQGYHAMSEVAEITIGGQPGIAAPEQMKDAMRGRAYGTRFTASGFGPFTWSLTNGSLPAGLSLVTDNGAIVGTPAATGSFPFTVAVENDYGTGNRNYVLEVLANVDRAIRIRASDGPWLWNIEPDDGPGAVTDGDDTVFERRSKLLDYVLDTGVPEGAQ
ncbi:MAG: S8 family serine peptidase [Planctomycetota bacterium]